ncbi:very short patch repair endonuclease [Hamadaea sp. NPDC050747]|uniref:very short patch repair endonuclease n=1 Tax=Hamadaea sp. NPDC050747 TaxID=3155789 RepID=UPI0034033642
MSRMPRASTRPEVAVRRAMHRLGLRFRIHQRLPGRPDIALTRARIAVFIDGCFWHRCPQHGTSPRNNAEWWQAKLGTNVARDQAVNTSLRELGWAVIRVWEHEDPDEAAARIREAWLERLSDPAGQKKSPSSDGASPI